ncbi:hypothetical protein [Streptomyces sp. NRRL F-5123]|nr:hypothetical protein [Streptomyces sp. NRRL F-5123]
MHRTLAEYARCLDGDEYGPVPACDGEHKEPVGRTTSACRQV